MNSDLELRLRVDRDAKIPLATQLTQQLTLLIADGRLPPGAELPPVRKLAETLGVNLHTVRAAYRQLDNRGLVSVSAGRRSRVIGYDGSTHMRRTQLSYSIGVILPAYSPFYAPFIDGVEFGGDPTLLFLCNVRDNPELALLYLNRLGARGVDGVIIASPFSHDGFGLRLKSLPLVFVDWPSAPGPMVNFDHEGAGFMATRHVIEHSHERIGMVTPPVAWSNVAPRLAGYQRALEDAGLAFDPSLVAESVGFEADHASLPTRQLMELSKPPTAIFSVSDTLGLGVISELARQSARVPDDVAVVSADGIAMGALANPPLTTVKLPAYELGAEARSMLDRLKAGEELSSADVVLPVELVVRSSCGFHD